MNKIIQSITRSSKTTDNSMGETFQMTALKSVEQFISSFNQAWLHGKWDTLTQLLHKEVVFVLPNLVSVYEGRQKCMDSIREYTQHAQTKSFNVTRSDVRIWGPTASVVLDYEVSYEINGETFAEIGTEVWTLTREGNQWQIVWRGLIRNESAD